MFIKIRRLVALYIDYFLIFFFCYYFIRLIDIFDNIFYDFFLGILGLVLFFNLFIRKDCLFGYESIGKKVMFLKIYQRDIRIVDKKLLIGRVCASISSLPFYLFMILINNKSSGDIKYRTEVK